MINSVLLDRYTVIKKIDEGGISEIYLARDLTNNKLYAVKILKQQFLSDRIEDLIRFNAEASTLSSLNHENILKVFHIGQSNKRYFIVMEYLKGKNLFLKMKSGYRFSIDETLTIITQLCKALNYIHIKGIIHQDLTPGNIILTGSDDQETVVKIIDFGLAQIKEFGAITDSEEIIGTFSYMSPEQCGVIKRPVDERSDLYSLGIIFYQLLSGELPIKGESVSEIIHKHIAVTPSRIKKYNNLVPEIIEKIVYKLIEKEPAKRYQSARGLLIDLERYLEGYTDFSLGEYDKVVEINLRTEIIGRSKEINFLNSKLMGCLKKNGSMCLIRGAAGIGKTRLAQEIQSQVYAYDGMVINCKCYKAMTNTPYGPFQDALNIYIKQYNKRNDWEKKEITEKIKNEIGNLGRIITDFNPAMVTILGHCPDIVELEADRENRRFLMVMTNLFNAIAQTDSCLMFQIDNIQWIDEGSTALLNELMKSIHNIPLLLIATLNSESIDDNHVLFKLINDCQNNGYPFFEIDLEAFDLDSMSLFIAGLLYQKIDDIKEIAEFIQTKSNGNPFFAEELLRQMVDEHVLQYNENKWELNKEILKTIEISETLTEIIIKRMSLLSRDEKKILSYASVIGKTIDINILLNMEFNDNDRIQSEGESDPAEGSIADEQVVKTIDRAIELHFMERDPVEKGKVLFAHNRVWDAFISLIDPEKKKQLHSDILNSIEKTTKNRSESLLYDLAYHAIEANDDDRILKYVLNAAKIAKNNYANDEALRYFKIVMSKLESRSIEFEDFKQRYLKKWLSCLEAVSEIYLRIGELDDAINLYSELLKFKNNRLEQAIINRQICYAYFKKGDWARCEQYGDTGLKLLNEKLPLSRFMVICQLIKEFFKYQINSLLFKNNVYKQKEKQLNIDKNKILIYVVTNWMYILSDVNKFVAAILRMLNISWSKLGKSKELAMSIGSFASMLMAIPIFKKALKYHAISISLRKELKDEWGLGQSQQWIGYCYTWSGDLKESIEHFSDSLKIFRNIGDIWEIGMILGGLSYDYYLLSDYNNALFYSREYQKISKQLSDHYGLARCYWTIAFSLLESGELKNAEEYAFDGLQLSKKHDIKFNICCIYVLLGSINIEKAEYEQAIFYLEKAWIMDKQEHFIKNYIVNLYPLLAEAYLYNYFLGRLVKQTRSGAKLKKIKKLCKLALQKTRKWPCHYGSALRVNAMFYAYVLNDRKAEYFFHTGIDQLSHVGRKYEMAKMLLENAKYLNRNNQLDFAKTKIKSAMRIFKEIGAKLYLEKMSNMIGISNVEKHFPPSNVMISNRLTTIISVSQNLSSILDIDELLEFIMQKSIEVTGAQRGYLFMKNSNDELELTVTKDVLTSNSIEYSKGIVDSVFSTGKMIITTNAEKDKKLSENKSVIWYGLKSILCVPILHHDNIRGICYLDNPLSSGVFTEEDSNILSVFMAQAGIAIDNAYLYKNLELKVDERTRELHEVNNELNEAYSSLNETYTTMKEDLALARKLQLRLLPDEKEITDKLDFAIRFYSMSEIGGDIYDIIKINSNYFRLFLADATGHGVQAALITMIIRSEYDKLKKKGKDPSVVVRELNEIFFSTYRNLNIIFSCLVMDIDLNKNEIKLTSAGHPPQYMLKNNSVDLLDNKGKIIGLMPNCTYTVESYKYNNGDKLILLTDGLYEEFNDNGVPFGEERVIRILTENSTKPIHDTIESLFDKLNEFVRYRKKMNENDDITVIGIQYI